MARFTVSTRLNGHPPKVWKSAKPHFELDKVKMYKDKLGRYYLIEVEAFHSTDAVTKGESLIENYVRCSK